MRSGPKPKYIHLLRAMRKGDVLFLPATSLRFDRQLSGDAIRRGGRIATVNFVGVPVRKIAAEHVVRIMMLEPLTK